MVREYNHFYHYTTTCNGTHICTVDFEQYLVYLEYRLAARRSSEPLIVNVKGVEQWKDGHSVSQYRFKGAFLYFTFYLYTVLDGLL